MPISGKWKVLFSSESGDWRTPDDLFRKLEAEFGGLFDVSDTHDGTFDAFVDPWPPQVYANPPYGRGVKAWLERCVEEIQGGLVEVAVFLLPARTDTALFHDLVLPVAREIRFLRGRLRFSDYKSGAPFPSMIVVYSAAE